MTGPDENQQQAGDKHSNSLCNGKMETKQINVFDEKLVKTDSIEKKERSLETTDASLPIVAGMSKELPTENPDKKAAEETIVTSPGIQNNTNCTNQHDKINEQAQKILGKNFQTTLNLLSPDETDLEHSSDKFTESENWSSASDTDKTWSPSMDGYSSQKKRWKQLGHEVENAYEELVLAKEESPKSINVAARKLLSDHSESRVPEYFQKTLKKDNKLLDSHPKQPIPRSDFKGPVNIGLRQKDYLKKAVKPTVTPCTHLVVKEVTMDMQMVSHVSSSVLTVNKDGTVDHDLEEECNAKPPILTSSEESENDVLFLKVENKKANCGFIPTARKSCVNGITKKGILQTNSTLKDRKSNNVMSKRILISTSEESDSSFTLDDSSDSCVEVLYVPPPHHKLTARKSLCKPHRYFTARKSVPSLSKTARKPFHSPPKTARKSLPSLQKAARKSFSSPLKTARKSVPSLPKTARKSVPSLPKTARKSVHSPLKTARKSVPSLKKIARKSVPSLVEIAKKSVSSLPKTARKSITSLSNTPECKDLNKTIKQECLQSANKMHMLKQTNNKGIVTNYVLVPIPGQSDRQKSTGVLVEKPQIATAVENGLDLPGTVKIPVNDLISKHKVPVTSVNNFLKKTSRKGVDIRRGKRKRKAPRRFQSSQSSDEEKQPVPNQKQLVKRNIEHKNGINFFREKAHKRPLQIQMFKNKKFNRTHKIQDVGDKQENILTEKTNSLLASAKLLNCVKASKANVLIPTNLVKGRTVNELLSIVDMSKAPIKNGERPLSLLLPTSSPITSLGSSNTGQKVVIQHQMPTVLPVTSSFTSPDSVEKIDKKSVADENSKLHKNYLSDGNSKISQTLLNTTKNSAVEQNVSDRNQYDQSAIEIPVQEVQLSRKDEKSDKDILPAKGGNKIDNIFSVFKSIKRESERSIPLKCTEPEVVKDTDSSTDRVKLFKSCVNGSNVSGSMSFLSVSNHELGKNSIQSNSIKASEITNNVVSNNPTQDIKQNDGHFQKVEMIDLNDMKKNLKQWNNKVTESLEENMSVDLYPEILEQTSELNEPSQNTFKMNQMKLKNKLTETEYSLKKAEEKRKRKRKVTYEYRAQQMRQKNKLKRLEAIDNQHEVSEDITVQPRVSTTVFDDSILSETCESTKRKNIKVNTSICCCLMENTSSQTNSGICEAVEYVDGGILLCTEKVEYPVLCQPSTKISAITLCKDHRRKALVHGWCPGCGCFCSMGTFMECRRDHTRHHFHSECIAEVNNTLYCPHCGEDASRAHKVTNIIPDNLSLITAQELQMQRQIRLPIALLETVESNIIPSFIEQYESSNKRARMGGKSLCLPNNPEENEQDKESCSVKLKNGKSICTDFLSVGPSRSTLIAALKCINTFKSKKLGFTPKNLYLPSLKGDLMKVIALLVEGFDPNHRFPEYNYETAMHAAATKGHHVILYVLLQAGGNCNAKDEDTQTPLMCTAANKHIECFKQLIFNGADVSCKDDEGTAALHIAAKNGFLEGVQYLTSLSVTNVNIQDDGGWTPLVWGAEARHLDVVQHLLDRGCDPNITDQEGNSGLHWAAYAGAHDIIKLFIESNCDVNAANHNGDTPLHIAAREDRYDSVVTLLMREANTLLKNREKDTALDCCDAKSNVYLALQVNQKIRQASALRTVRSERILSKDISRGREARPIQVVNAVDNFPIPTDFLYVANSCEKSSLNIDRRIIHMKGCKCDDDCALDSCFCCQSSTKCWYNKNGKLVDEFNYQDPPLIFECGRACNCWMNCKNRVVQHGIRCHLQLFRTNKMGWGLRAMQKIPKGTFICEYAGELISDEEADRRQDDSYLFDLDNREGDVYCIDARYYGNISRFINHLCEPNIVPVRIFIDHHDLRFPRIVFFTSRDVDAYEELGFDYGDKFWAIKSKYFNCCCGSAYCKHPLPRPDQEQEDPETEEEIVVD
ncbi:uncharacterized protein [Antedon mediterranea]|uniref:uncharacterized protein n=1 Tax=Antedon mediterranea TaxID=105859 RepID=UPI003AF834B5